MSQHCSFFSFQGSHGLHCGHRVKQNIMSCVSVTYIFCGGPRKLRSPHGGCKYTPEFRPCFTSVLAQFSNLASVVRRRSPLPPWPQNLIMNAHVTDCSSVWSVCEENSCVTVLFDRWPTQRVFYGNQKSADRLSPNVDHAALQLSPEGRSSRW